MKKILLTLAICVALSIIVSVLCPDTNLSRMAITMFAIAVAGIWWGALIVAVILLPVAIVGIWGWVVNR